MLGTCHGGRQRKTGGVCVKNAFQQGELRPTGKRGTRADIWSTAIPQISGGREFTVVTDHKPLLKILGPYEGVPTLAASRLQRWALILSDYKYRLQYKPGMDNKEADLLSRLPLTVQVIDPNEQIYGIDYCEQLPVTAAEVAKETQTDPVLKKVYQYTMFGWTEPVDKNL